MAMGTLCTGERPLIYGDGDTLHCQKAPHMRRWRHLALAKIPSYMAMGTHVPLSVRFAACTRPPPAPLGAKRGGGGGDRVGGVSLWLVPLTPESLSWPPPRPPCPRGGEGQLVPGAVLSSPLPVGGVPSRTLGCAPIPLAPLPSHLRGGRGAAWGAGAGGWVLVGCAPPSLRALFRPTPPRARTSSGPPLTFSASVSSSPSSRPAPRRRPADSGGRTRRRLCRGSSR